jgi:hypothetical protein
MRSATEATPSVQVSLQPITREVEEINGLLSFKDGQAFDRVIDQLDAADDKWNDEFLLEVAGLAIEDLDGLSLEALDGLAEIMEREEIRRGISGDLIYEIFENEFGYTSLRSLLVRLENNFLDNENPDWDNNPDDHYVTGTAERTLLNARGEIMVGGILYKFMPNGIIYEVTDGDFGTLWQIGPGHAETIFEAPNVVVHNYEPLAGRRNCRTWVRNIYRCPISNEFKYKNIIGHGSMLFTNRIFSTVKHYRKKGKRWKRRRAYLVTYNWGYYGLGDPGSLNASCRYKLEYESGIRANFRRRLTARQRTFGLGFGKVKSGDVHSYHRANDSSKELVLEF